MAACRGKKLPAVILRITTRGGERSVRIFMRRTTVAMDAVAMDTTV